MFLGGAGFIPVYGPPPPPHDPSTGLIGIDVRQWVLFLADSIGGGVGWIDGGHRPYREAGPGSSSRPGGADRDLSIWLPWRTAPRFEAPGPGGTATHSGQ